jgi:hypothetical protein
VNKLKFVFSLTLAVACACLASAQQPLYEQFRARNAVMTAIEPAWMSPLIQPDPRLSQSVRLSFSNSYTPGRTQTVNYGNGHTVGVILGDRVQLNAMAPAYFQNHSAAAQDGFGDTMVEGKYRLVSGNAQHGDFAVTALLAYSAPTGSHRNGAATGVYFPTLAAGHAWGRFNVQTTLGGSMPTGKIAAQGRSISWNWTAQLNATKHAWLDIEDNPTFNFGGPFDRKTENFVTPAAFYLLRRKAWAPTHSFLVFDCGMQIATSGFHTYNHNLIAETRYMF